MRIVVVVIVLFLIAGCATNSVKIDWKGRQIEEYTPYRPVLPNPCEAPIEWRLPDASCFD